MIVYCYMYYISIISMCLIVLRKITKYRFPVLRANNLQSDFGRACCT